MTPSLSLFTDLTVISCPRCGANYVATQAICPRCRGRGRGGGKVGCAEGARNDIKEPIPFEDVQAPIFKATEGKESDLQEEVEAWLRERHYYFFHDRSRRANCKGFLDLVIAAPRGITLWTECKTRSGQLTADQKKTIQHLSALGHHVKVVRSLEELKAWVEGLLTREGTP